MGVTAFTLTMWVVPISHNDTRGLIALLKTKKKAHYVLAIKSLTPWKTDCSQKEKGTNLRDLIAATGLEKDLEIWLMTSKNNIASLLTTSSFMHHFKSIGEFKLELQSRNAQFGSKSVIFLSCVTSKFDGWPWKTIGHLFYTMLSLAYHFKAIGEFKLELQSGSAWFRS